MNPNIFREYDIRGIVGDHLTDESVATLGNAIGTFFRQNNAKRIAIGYDARVSSPGFCKLLTDGFTASGLDVVLVGMVPTPVLYHTVYTRDVDGGVMITGSHNPPDHNGFKICLGKGTLFGSQIQEIKEIAMKAETRPVGSVSPTTPGTVETITVLDEYCRDIVSGIKLGPRKIKAVIDAGNGMGGVTGVPVYRELGIEMVELFTEPDSSFPNHHPDPTVTENLEDVIAKVRETKADIGKIGRASCRERV